MFREVRSALLPPHSLVELFPQWREIVDQLSEPPRRRARYSYY